MTQAALTEFAARLLSYDGNCVFFVSADDAHGLLLDAEQLTGGPVVWELRTGRCGKGCIDNRYGFSPLHAGHQ